MGISFKLAIKYLKQNKRRTIGTIIGITISITLLISVFLIFTAYRNYMIDLERSKKNWEMRYNNISYEKVYGLTENSDIKEVSVIQNLGIYAHKINIKDEMSKNINLKAYDENALKNMGIHLLEGRFPQRSNEIIISKNFQEIVDTIIINEKKYNIVGIIEPTEYDLMELDTITIGAITFLDKEDMETNTKVDVYVNFYKVDDIYNISEEIASVLKLYSNDDIKNENIEFNTDLLHYYSVWNMNSEEDREIIALITFFIIVIILISAMMIYCIFNISVIERKKEFAILNSIGTTKNQIFEIILYESAILLIISIIVSVLVNGMLLLTTANYMNNILSSVNIDFVHAYENTIKNIPYKEIVTSIIIVTIATLVASILPAIKACKSSIFEGMKENINVNIKQDILCKKQKSVTKILTYRHKKLNSYKYKTVVVGVMVSIFLLLVTQGYLKNFFNVANDNYICNYSIIVNNNISEEVKESFMATNTVKSMYSYMCQNLYIQLADTDINDSLKLALEKCPTLKEKMFYTSVENELNCNIYALSENDFSAYIKEIGLEELSNNECVLINYSDVETDYYKGVYLTNYKEGQNLELYLYSKNDGTINIDSIDDFNNINEDDIETYGDEQRKVGLKIAKVVNISPSMISKNSKEIPKLCIIVKENTLNNMVKYLLYAENNNYENVPTWIEVYSTNRELLDETLAELQLEHGLTGDKLINSRMYIEQDNQLEKIEITKIFLYAMTILISTISLISIINIIISDIDTRKQYFFTLLSVGMTKKQLNKMLLNEYGKYFLFSFLGGIILSCIVTYWGYIKMNKHEFYTFKIPFMEIIIILIVLLAIVFFIICFINKKIEKNNIIDVIKNKRM